MKLEGRVALVTGAGRNLGRAVAIALAREGARVAVNGLQDRAKLDEVVGIIREGGGQALPVLADVSDPAQVEQMVETVTHELGPVDVLVNNAAIRPRGPLLTLTPDQWHKVMAVNLDAAFYLCKSVVPGMIEKGSGSIIAFSGLNAFGMRGDGPATAASKGGLIALMRSIANNYGVHGIRANAIVPGNMDTDNYDQDAYLTDDVSLNKGTKSNEESDRIPLRRRGSPDEAATTCVFLASDDSGYITGQTLHLGGGLYMG